MVWVLLVGWLWFVSLFGWFGQLVLLFSLLFMVGGGANNETNASSFIKALKYSPCIVTDSSAAPACFRQTVLQLAISDDAVTVSVLTWTITAIRACPSGLWFTRLLMIK